jgi:hypothetical protein
MWQAQVKKPGECRASASATAGQPATVSINVYGQVESATVTPANGTVGVALTAEI